VVVEVSRCAACRELDTSDIFRRWDVAGVEFTAPGYAGHDQRRSEGITLEMRPALGFSVELLRTKDP